MQTLKKKGTSIKYHEKGHIAHVHLQIHFCHVYAHISKAQTQLQLDPKKRKWYEINKATNSPKNVKGCLRERQTYTFSLTLNLSEERFDNTPDGRSVSWLL